MLLVAPKCCFCRLLIQSCARFKIYKSRILQQDNHRALRITRSAQIYNYETTPILKIIRKFKVCTYFKSYTQRLWHLYIWRKHILEVFFFFIKERPVIKVKVQHSHQITKINQKPNKEARVKKQALVHIHLACHRLVK